MNESDAIRLRHMLDAVREALGFMEGRTVEDLRRDRMFFLALVKEIEIIGEAASRISDADVDLSIIWSTATTALPDLGRELEKALGKS